MLASLVTVVYKPRSYHSIYNIVSYDESTQMQDFIGSNSLNAWHNCSRRSTLAYSSTTLRKSYIPSSFLIYFVFILSTLFAFIYVAWFSYNLSYILALLSSTIRISSEYRVTRHNKELSEYKFNFVCDKSILVSLPYFLTGVLWNCFYTPFEKTQGKF